MPWLGAPDAAAQNRIGIRDAAGQAFIDVALWWAAGVF